MARALKAEGVEALFTLCRGYIIDITVIGKTHSRLDASADLHIGFHQAIIALSTSQWLAMMTESWVIHRCAMRARTIGENDRAQRSIIDHMHVMTALEDRDADLTACQAREHTLGWAAPMEKNATYLDEGQLTSALG